MFDVSIAPACVCAPRVLCDLLITQDKHATAYFRSEKEVDVWELIIRECVWNTKQAKPNRSVSMGENKQAKKQTRTYVRVQICIRIGAQRSVATVRKGKVLRSNGLWYGTNSPV